MLAIVVYGQRDLCTEPTFPFPGTPETTLCEELSEIQFDLYIGAGTGITHSSQISNPLPTQEFRIVGDFIIDNHFVFANSVLMIDPDISIIIQEGAHLVIDNSKLFACEDLWNGIVLSDYSKISTINNTVIEDAKTAIQIWDKVYTFLDIEETVFNRNKVGISLKNPSMFPHGPTVFTFKNNIFSCDAPLNGTFTDITFAGIELENVHLFVKNSPFTKTSFMGLENGIYSTGICNVHVNYFDFENIQNNGIYHESTTLKASNCTFTQCTNKSINASKIRYLDLNLCNFTTDFTGGSFDVIGVFGTDFELNSDIDIRNCVFNFTRPLGNSKTNIGIYLKAGLVSSGENINLFDNDFSFNVFGGECIRIEGSYKNANSIRIERNKFLDCILADEFIRINDGDKSNLAIISNTVDGNNLWNGTSATTPQRGFVLEGSTGSNNEVSSNRFLRDFTDPTSSIANSNVGIQAEMFSDTKYCDNSIADVAIQMRFSGLNIGTDLSSNNLIVGTTAFRLNGIIGPQGVEGGVHKGNTWQNFLVPPSFVFTASTHAECLSGNCNLSPFFVNTPQVLPFSGTLIPEKFPQNVFPNDWFKYDPQGTNSSTCVSQLTGNNPTANVLYSAIANEDLNEEAGIVWEAETYLYDKLMVGEISTSGTSMYSSFQEEKRGTSLEQFYSVSENLSMAYENEMLSSDLENYKHQKSLVEIEIESLESEISNNGIAEDSKVVKEELLNEINEINLNIENLYVDYKLHLQDQLNVILSENEQINPSEIFESNKKQINRIIINSILNNNEELLGQNISELLAIAIQCPQIGGMAVYQARGLLPACIRSEYEEIFGRCYPDLQIENRLANPELQVVENTSEKVKIYPNPASKSIFISHNDNFNGVVKLYDSLGHLCLTKKLSGNNMEIEIDLPKGLYFLSINWDNGNIDRESLVVQ